MVWLSPRVGCCCRQRESLQNSDGNALGDIGAQTLHEAPLNPSRTESLLVSISMETTCGEYPENQVEVAT